MKVTERRPDEVKIGKGAEDLSEFRAALDYVAGEIEPDNGVTVTQIRARLQKAAKQRDLKIRTTIRNGVVLFKRVAG